MLHTKGSGLLEPEEVMSTDILAPAAIKRIELLFMNGGTHTCTALLP